MKKTIFTFLLVTACLIQGYTQTSVGGVLNENTIWTKANSPYLLTSPLLVAEGVTLTIQPGVEVQMEREKYLRVDGELIAEGTELEPIVFSPLAGIYFEGTAVDYDSATHTGCRITYAEFNTRGNIIPNAEISNQAENVDPVTNGQVSILIANSWFNLTQVRLFGKGGKRIPEKTIFSHNHITGGQIIMLGTYEEGSNTVLRGNQFERCDAYFQCGDVEYNSFNDCNGINYSEELREDWYTMRHNYFNSAVYMNNLMCSFDFNTSVVNEGYDEVQANIYGSLFSWGPRKPSKNNNFVGRLPYRYRTFRESGYTDDLSGNYWGTASLDSANAMIYDFDKDFNLAQVIIDPILTSPDTDAPAFIQGMASSPGDTIENGPVSLEFRFSKPMEVSDIPVIGIGSSRPYDDFVFDEGSWSDGNQIYTVTASNMGALESNVSLGVSIALAKGAGDLLPIPETRYESTFYVNRPASIDTVIVQPNDTVFSGSLYVRVRFSKDMDREQNPQISFGSEAPYEQYTMSDGYWNGSRAYYAEFNPLEDLPIGVPFSLKITGAWGLGDPSPVAEEVVSNAFIRVNPVEISQVDYVPGDTIEEEDLTLSITFSEAMDAEYMPQINFGGMAPYTDYAFPQGSWTEDNTCYSSTLENTAGLPPFVSYHVRVSNIKAKNADNPVDGLILEETFYRNAYYTDTVHVMVYDTMKVTVTDTLLIHAVLSGIDSPDNINTLQVYPNPASDYVMINTGDYTLMSGYVLRIFDQKGVVVFETNVEEALYEIDLSDWTGYGLYFIQLRDPSGNPIATRKIVLQE